MLAAAVRADALVWTPCGWYDWFADFLDRAFRVSTGYESLWSQELASPSPVTHAKWYWAIGKTVGLELLVTLLAVIGAGWYLNRNWREGGPSPLWAWLFGAFCTLKFWLAIFHRLQRRRLERSPIGWLGHHAWSDRLTRWGWCLAVIVAETPLARGMDDSEGFLRWQPYLAFALLAGMAFSAAGSFHRERENGALELLLVCPLSEEQIVLGRIWDLWKQFLPAGLILLITWTVGLRLVPHFADGMDYRALCWLPFAFVPVVGLYCSLRCKRFITALVCTIMGGIVVPFVLMLDPFHLSHWPSPSGLADYTSLTPNRITTLAFEVVAGSVMLMILLSQLRRRAFAFTPSQGEGDRTATRA